MDPGRPKRPAGPIDMDPRGPGPGPGPGPLAGGRASAPTAADGAAATVCGLLASPSPDAARAVSQAVSIGVASSANITIPSRMARPLGVAVAGPVTVVVGGMDLV